MNQSRKRSRLHDHPVVERVRVVDARIDAALDRIRSPALDRIFFPLSSAADHGLLWLAIGAIRGAVWRRHARSAVRLGVVMGVESAVTNGIVKSFFRRVRPELGLPVEDRLPYGLHRPRTSAFPSGHATSAFTAAGFLAVDDPLAPAYGVLAALVAFSRVYVRMHHASDVVVGSLLGRAFGRIARHIARAGLD